MDQFISTNTIKNNLKLSVTFHIRLVEAILMKKNNNKSFFLKLFLKSDMLKGKKELAVEACGAWYML